MSLELLWERFNERFDCSGGALDTGRVRNGVSTYAPRRDDACVWIRRELAPSYVHGLVWGRILDRRSSCHVNSVKARHKCFATAHFVRIITFFIPSSYSPFLDGLSVHKST